MEVFAPLLALLAQGQALASSALAPAAVLYERALSSAPVAQFVTGPVDALLAPLHDVANAYLASLDACLARYLLVGVLLTYPLAAVTRLLPGRAARDAWLAGCGALTCYFVFGRAWESLLLIALLCFAVLQARGLPQRHIVAVVLASGYLVSRKWAQASNASSEGMDDTVLHVVFGEPSERASERASGRTRGARARTPSPSAAPPTSPVAHARSPPLLPSPSLAAPAVAVVKLFTLAFSISDGETIEARLAANASALAKKAGAAKDDKAVRALEQERRALETFRARAVMPSEAPGVLAYLGYVLNFTAVLGGPAFDFREYCDAQARSSAELARLPARLLPAVWKWLQGVLYLAAMAVLLQTYHERGLYRFAAWRGDHLNPAGVFLNLPATVSFADGEAACRAACEAATAASPATCHADVSASFLGYDIPGSLRPAWEYVPPSVKAIPYARPLGLCGSLASAVDHPGQCSVTPAQPFNCLMFAEPRPALEGFASFVPYAALTLMIVRVGYYAFWKLSEGAAVLAGFGFRSPERVAESRKRGDSAAGKPALFDALWLLSVLGVPLETVRAALRALCCSQRFEPTLALFGVCLPGDAPAGDWEGVSNVSPVTVETRTSMKDVIVHWNCQVQAWLQNYIYIRTPQKVGPVAKANKYATMTASAVWHGFFPGYYLSFATAPIIQECMVAAYASTGAVAAAALGWAPRAEESGCQFPASPAWLPLRLLWCALRLAATFLTFAYSLAPFVVLRFNKGAAIWAYCAFLGHLVPLALMAAAALLEAVLAPRRGGAKAKGAAAAAAPPAPAAAAAAGPAKVSPTAALGSGGRRHSSNGAGAAPKHVG
jgi:hypothetical protein